MQANMAFTYVKEKFGEEDGPLKYITELIIDKNKSMAPEDWKGGLDIDKKPVPPDLEYDESEEFRVNDWKLNNK